MICPTCLNEGKIVTTWGTDGATPPDRVIHAQWRCPQRHYWYSKSSWRIDQYEIVAVTRLRLCIDGVLRPYEAA